MNILHLSDLHFGTRSDAENWYSQLAEDLFHELKCTQLDLLILSGDVANRAIPEEYTAAECFLRSLCREFNLSSEQMVVVPGNHDVNWSIAKRAYTPMRREEYMGPLGENGAPDENYAIDKGEFVEVQDLKKYEERFKNFGTFYSTITGSPYPLDYGEQVILHHFPTRNLLVLGLNSAWQLDHHYRSRASIHPNALSGVLTHIRQNPQVYGQCLKFAVWHHPLHNAGDDHISDMSFMQRLAQAGFCAAFHGHVHKAHADLYQYDINISGRRVNIVCAGTFGASTRQWTPGYPLQYNLLRIEGARLIVETRCRREPNGAWKPDAIWTQGPGRDPLPRYKIVLPEATGTEPDLKTIPSRDIASPHVELVKCPYRGLLPFREQDEEFFFGREGFTDRLIAAVQDYPLLSVIGPSGSGKSSVIFAGLVPYLRRQGDWLISAFSPGANPFHELARSLESLVETMQDRPDMQSAATLTPDMDVHGIIERMASRNVRQKALLEIRAQIQKLRQGESLLEEIIKRILAIGSCSRLLLIADQFEELYTLCQEKEIREHFLRELLLFERVTVPTQKPCFNLVIALRADFLGKALSEPYFSSVFQNSSAHDTFGYSRNLLIGSMTFQELRSAIEGPAAAVGLHVEPGLVEDILDSVAKEPGNLPLLEFALTLLWNYRSSDMLTKSAYEEIGRIEKSLARYAESIYKKMSADEKEQAQHIFVQLVQPGEGTEDSRRIATRTEVGEEQWKFISEMLAPSRLVVTQGSERIGEEKVTLAHEALITEWERLQNWMRIHHQFRTWQELLRAAIRQWKRSGQDNSALLRGALLEEARRWQAKRPDFLSDEETRYIQESLRQETEARTSEEETEALRKANLRIVELERPYTMSTVAVDFAHRLNNVAGTIPIWVDLIEDRINEQGLEIPEIQRYLDSIRTDTAGILRAVEQLREPPRKTKVGIASLLLSLVRQVRVQSSDQIEIIEDLQSELHDVLAWSSSLTSAIFSIISNALDAMGGGPGILTVQASNYVDEAGKLWVRIVISDTGVGIPADYHNRIFEPFFTTKESGMGYGLWRAKTIIESLEGQIWVESQMESGTTFTIMLPALVEAENADF